MKTAPAPRNDLKKLEDDRVAAWASGGSSQEATCKLEMKKSVACGRLEKSKQEKGAEKKKLAS